jgi:hypothetical protein
VRRAISYFTTESLLQTCIERCAPSFEQDDIEAGAVEFAG